MSSRPGGDGDLADRLGEGVAVDDAGGRRHVGQRRVVLDRQGRQAELRVAAGDGQPRPLGDDVDRVRRQRPGDLGEQPARHQDAAALAGLDVDLRRAPTPRSRSRRPTAGCPRPPAGSRRARAPTAAAAGCAPSTRRPRRAPHVPPGTSSRQPTPAAALLVGAGWSGAVCGAHPLPTHPLPDQPLSLGEQCSWELEPQRPRPHPECGSRTPWEKYFIFVITGVEAGDRTPSCCSGARMALLARCGLVTVVLCRHVDNSTAVHRRRACLHPWSPLYPQARPQSGVDTGGASDRPPVGDLWTRRGRRWAAAGAPDLRTGRRGHGR